jgi:hypothetical protein
MNEVYKIYSLNSDLYYLLRIPKQKYTSKFIHKIIFDYKKLYNENKKSKNDDLYIVIQKNNICYDKVNDYNTTYEAYNYIYDIITKDSKCINNKQHEYKKNDIRNIILKLGKIKITKKDKNRNQYLKRKQKLIENNENE